VTTIAVSRSLLMMAADGNMTIDGVRQRSDSKIFRFRDFIVGAAGDDTDIVRFLDWLKRRQPRERVPKTIDVDAVLLYRDGRITWFGHRETEIGEDHYAVGTGEKFALAAMDTLFLMGLPVDPRIAVRAACLRDPGSAEPVQSLRWKPQCRP
jgi:ATP-dependent protease HslVU (ClpYQ) peptidase subunit